MLKVVGASWTKIYISSAIIFGSLLLAIGALFIAEMERPLFDGTYCATAFWSPKSGFRIEFWGQRNDLPLVPKGVARTCYRETTLENGWSQIEIETQPIYSDRVQAFAAGFLEGALTWRSIYNHWFNTIHAYCEASDDAQTFCTWLRDTITANYDEVRKMAKKRAGHDHYWHQVQLFYEQIEGLEVGWRRGAKRSRSGLDDLSLSEFLLMNAGADLHDLRVVYDRMVSSDGHVSSGGQHSNASMVLKMLSVEGIMKMLVGHSSEGSYSAMLRVLKKYHFAYHTSPETKNSGLVAGTSIVFTGYPGVIASTDDFYTITGRHAKMTVAGVEIRNNNHDLWRNVDLMKSVLLSARVMAANRLAHSAHTWVRAMSRSSGTGSKQWVIVNTKNLRESTVDLSSETDLPKSASFEVPREKGMGESLVWIVDQLPGRLHGEDVTDSILVAGVWRANGVPYFDDMKNASHTSEESETERLLMQRPFENVTSLEEMAVLLKSQAYRGDLDRNHPKPSGNIDVKLISECSNGESEFHALAGPLFQKKSQALTVEALVYDSTDEHVDEIVMSTHENRKDVLKKDKPFQWSRAHESGIVSSHGGHPDVWNFGSTSPQWAWAH